MKKICLQAGHINCQFNSIVSLRGNTGAPGEQELNKRIADRTAAILREKGFEVKQTDACANDDKSITKNDWDLFLAIHGDADNPNSAGGTVGVCDPKADGAAAESGRIKEVIRSEYFKHSEITDLNFTTVNILKYYMWQYLSAKTPCVLIELGQVQDPHDKVLLADTDRISNALARGICKAFDVQFDIPAPVIDPKDKIIADLTSRLDKAEKVIVSQQTDFATQVAEIRKECQTKTDSIKTKATEIVNLCQ